MTTITCSMIYLTQHGRWSTIYYIRYRHSCIHLLPLAHIFSNCKYVGTYWSYSILSLSLFLSLPLPLPLCVCVLQKILRLDLFPDSVFETEMKYYMTKLNEVHSLSECFYYKIRSTYLMKRNWEINFITVWMNDSMEYHWTAVQISRKLTGWCGLLHLVAVSRYGSTCHY